MLIRNGGTGGGWKNGGRGGARHRYFYLSTHAQLTMRLARPFPPSFNPPTPHSGPTATSVENKARFAESIHHNCPLPPRTTALASALAGVRVLALDERSSPVGGATDSLARALARSGGAKWLTSLDLAFQSYSAAADLFTCRGVAALAAGAGAALTAVRLAGATAVSDRGLAALGAHCPSLTEFEWRGYSELVSDSGLAALVRGGRSGSDRASRASSSLTRVTLDARLPRVTDAGIAALATACPRLTAITLPGGCTDAALASLAAAPCTATLTTVDASAAHGVTAAGAAALRAACPRLQRVVLAEERVV